ncbi:MAG: DUF4347 domain-containing protein [Alphaproteobacteria bacterium]|nr:DUF4347 domain-containing protein [Alphaproteobacteria bacterium]
MTDDLKTDLGATSSFGDSPQDSLTDTSAAALPDGTSGNGARVVVVDTTVSGYEALMDGVAQDAEIILVGEGGFDELAEALAGYSEISSLQVLSHGEVGKLYLGEDALTVDNISEFSGALSAIGDALSDGGDMLLFGCRIGDSGEGLDFLEALAAETGADVAASDDLTGNSTKGGDWDLEVNTGEIETSAAFSEISMSGFDAVLAPSNGTENFNDGVTLLATDNAGPVSNVSASGLEVTYSGNTDSVDIYIGTPNDATSNYTNSAFGVSDNALIFTHAAGSGGTTGSVQQIDYISLSADDDGAFNLDGFSFFYASSATPTFTVTAHDASGTQIGSAVTLSGFTTTTNNGQNVGYLSVSDGTLGSDFNSVVEFRINSDNGSSMALMGIDDVVISAAVSNSAPTVSSAPTDVSVTEDTASDVDLSAITFADSDGDSLTVTLKVDGGTFSTPGDGAAVGSGVTETLVNSTTITLVGSASDLNTYLDTTSNVQYTGASNTNGDDAATLTIAVTDGTDSASNTDVNIDITAVNDAPVLDNSQSPTLTAIDEDAGDDDGSSADGDDDGTNNTNNTGTTVATLVVDSSITDVDGSAVESIAVTTVDNTNGVWQYSTDSGTSWNNFSGTTGTSVDIESSARLLDSADMVRFVPDADYNGSATITFRAWDESSGTAGSTADASSNGGSTAFSSASDTASVTVNAVNDDPTISGLVTDVSVTEETAGNVDISASAFSDVDSSGSVTVYLIADTGTLSATSGGSVTVGGSGTGTLSLSGTFSNINTFLDTASAVQYTGATDVSGDDAATLTVRANDGDGSGNVDLGTVNIDITDVNDNPSISGLVSDITFSEDTAGNVDLSAADFTDVDSAGDVTVVLVASSGTFTSSNGADVTVGGSGSDTLTLSGTFDEIETFLDTTSSVQYTGSSNTNGNDAATITVIANDGEGSGNVTLGTVNADITAVNDDPTATGIVSDVAFDEDTAGDLDLSAIDFSDVDSSGDVTVTVVASSGTMAATSSADVTIGGSGSDSLTLSGTFDEIETYLDTASSIQYTPGSNVSGDDAATVTIYANDDDGSGDVNLGAANVDINGFNDEPTLTATGEDPTFTEGGANSDVFSSVTVDTIESGQTITGLTLSVSNVSDSGSEFLLLDGTYVDITSDNAGTSATNSLTYSVVMSGSTATITLVGATLTEAQTQTLIDAIEYHNSSSTPTTASNRVVTISEMTDDGGSFGSNDDTATLSITSTITVVATNSDPTATGGPTDITVLEETASDLDLSSADFSDADSNGDATVTLVVDSGTLAATSSADVTVGGSGTDTLTLSGTLDEIETYLDTASAVQYTGGSDVSGDDAATLTVQANDGDGSGDVTVFTSNIDITDINDEPTLTATGQDPTFTEGGANSDLFSSVTADTIETGQTISDLTMTVTNVSDGSDEILVIDGTAIALTDSNSGTTATNSLSYSVSVSSGTATVSFSGGTMSEAATQTLIDGMVYQNASDDPTTGSNRVVTITSITDSGGNTGSNDDTATLSISSTVSITAVNDAPGIANLNGDSASEIVAGDGAQDVTDLNDVTITNADSDDYNGGFITINQSSGTTNGDWSVDGTTVTSGGDGSISAGETVQVSGVTIGTVDATDDGQGGNDLTINFTTANATNANIQTLIQNLLHSPPSGIGDRVFTLTLNDGDGTANGGDEDHAATFTVGVTSQPPEATGIPTDITVTEDTASNVDLSGVTFSDGDDTDLIITFTVDAGTLAATTGGGVTVSGSGTATLELTGNTDDINTFLDDTDAVQYTGAADANGDNAATLTITANDDNGSGDVNVGTANIDITNVNDAPSFGGDLTATMNEDEDTVGGTATVTDVDNPNTFDAATPGGTYGDIQIAANGDWTYDLDEANSDVQALNAGDTLQDTITVQSDDGSNQDIIITITGVNDAATFGGDLTGSIGEDTDTVGGTATVSDVDDADTFTADTVAGTYGTLTIATNGDWVYDLDEANGDVQALAASDTLQDTISVAADDGTTQDIVITIDGVNDAATIAGDLIGAINEDGTTDTGTATVTDTDTGENTFNADTIDGANGTLVIAANGDWTYTIDNSDSDVQALAAGDTLDDTITIESADGTSEDIVVTITGVNDLPTSSGGSVSTAEDKNKTFSSGNFNFSDVDTGDALVSVRIDTLPSSGTLKLSGVAVTAGDVIAVADISNLTYTPVSNQSGNTTFTYTVNDGTGFASSTATMTVKVTSVNDAPNDISVSSLSVTENKVGAVIGTVSVSDVDDDTHSLSVSDSRFTINANGELKLKAGQSIDFETESSVTVTITANDDEGASYSESFTIAVTDVSEFTGGNDPDTVDGTDNDDLILPLGGNDKVNSGSGEDTIDGGDGDDTIDGGSDDDLLRGGLGNDNVIGGFGNDLVFAGLGDVGNDVVSGGGGLDSLGGGFGNDLLQGEDNDDLLWGRFGADTVDGGSGNDMLYNGEGTDTVIGGEGNDTLWAGNDDDFLSGGDGEDVFMFGAVSGNDTIRDFDIDDDQINLQYSGAGFNTVADVQAAASLTTKDGSSGVLIVWDDGNQSAFIVGLTLADLTSVDFVL